jgi:hypothetical protein
MELTFSKVVGVPAVTHLLLYNSCIYRTVILVIARADFENVKIMDARRSGIVTSAEIEA